MSDPVQKILDKVYRDFPSNKNKDMLQVFSDAASVCKRILWDVFPAIKAEYGKVLPDVLDRETAMWVRAIATAYIWEYESQVLEDPEDSTSADLQEVQEVLEVLKSDTALFEEYSRRTFLTVDSTTGKVNRELKQGYTVPDDVSNLITYVRRNGKLPDSERWEHLVHVTPQPYQSWELERKSWAERLKHQSDTDEWERRDWLSFRLAMFHARVFYMEARLHQAEMAILLHQIMSSSKDDKVRKLTESLLVSSPSEDEAKDWVDKNSNEIADLKQLLQQYYNK